MGSSKSYDPFGLIKFSLCEGSVEQFGPEFGENNEEIYCRLLDYSFDDLKKWKRKKLI